jgi:hypothetical protein
MFFMPAAVVELFITLDQVPAREARAAAVQAEQTQQAQVVLLTPAVAVAVVELLEVHPRAVLVAQA